MFPFLLGPDSPLRETGETGQPRTHRRVTAALNVGPAWPDLHVFQKKPEIWN